MRSPSVLAIVAMLAGTGPALARTDLVRPLAKAQKKPAVHDKNKRVSNIGRKPAVVDKKAAAHPGPGTHVGAGGHADPAGHAEATRPGRPVMQAVIRDRIAATFHAIERERLGVLWINQQAAVLPMQERRDHALTVWRALYPSAPAVATLPTPAPTEDAPPATGTGALAALQTGIASDAPPAAGAPEPAATDSSKPAPQSVACDVTQVDSSPLRFTPDATAKVFFFGVSSPTVPQAELAAMQTLVEAYLPLPAQSSLMSLEDINSLLQAEKVKDLVGCDEPDCTSIVGGALDADVLLNGRIEKLNDKFVFVLRAIDARNQKVVGTATFEYSTPLCGQSAIEKACKELVLVSG